MRDTEVDPQVFADTNKAFCNMQLPCFQVNRQCLDKGVASEEVRKNDIDAMLREFDLQHDFSQKELRQRLRLDLERSVAMLPRISKLNRHRVMKFDRQQFKLGAGVAERNIVVSPSASVRDLILGQSDFVKKQNDIIRFKHRFARSPNEDEDQYWFYCPETQTKLLPTFVFTLAEAFTSQQNSGNMEEYKQALDKICADRGTVSEDGNSWVDKHSGYEIRSIEFDTDEGYEDTGYKMVSRATLEKDAGDHVLVGQQPDEIISGDTLAVHTVVRGISSFLGIDMSAQLDFISSNTLLTLSSLVGTEKAYDEKSARLLKTKGKGLPPYRDMKNTVLLMLTLAYLIVAIQITIPSVRTRKTFPGCVKAFTGYPLDGDTDMSTVFYISCVANKIKSSVEPWSALAKHNEKTISKKVVDLIGKHILTNETIRARMREKQAYLLIEQEEYVPIQHEIARWTNFLPPLTRIDLPATKPLAQGFMGKLQGELKDGSGTQAESLDAVRGKIIQFSLSVQKHIQTVVGEQDPILTNAAMEPFLANSCCNEEGNISTIGYFKKRQPDISKDNDYVKDLASILADVRLMRMAPFFYSSLNTRIAYPPLSTKFSEETIYRAFIVYCKYNNNLPLDDALRRICTDKPRDFDANWSIVEKIQALKDQGKILDGESLTELMNVVNGRNIVSVRLDQTARDPIETLRVLLEGINSRDEDVIPRDLTERFLAALDTYDTSSTQDSESTRNLKNYLATQIQTLTREVARTVSELSTLPKARKKVAVNLIETVMEWSTARKDDGSVSDGDATLFRMEGFMSDSLSNLVSVFPNIILNQVNHKDIKIPRHWALSERHQYDVRNIVATHYAGLKQFYGDEIVAPVLTRIQTDGRDVLDLIDATSLVAGVEGRPSNPLLGAELVGLLYHYYFINTLYQYILLANSPQFLVTEQPAVAASIDDRPGEGDQFLEQLAEADAADISQVEITQGEDALVKERVATLVNSMVGMLADAKKQIDYSHDEIMERVLRAKEKEKEGVTQRLKDMTDEAREVDTEFKRHKLGDWGKGLEKGLTQYVRETYDQEREALDKRLIMERQLGTQNVVSDMNMDIFVMDMQSQEARDAELDQDAYGMGDYEGENAEENENDGY